MTLKIGGEIHQLSTRGGSYINVYRAMADGGIGMWGNCYRHPTYLLLRSNQWSLVTFDDEARRDEILPELIKTWAPDKILVFPDMHYYEEEEE